MHDDYILKNSESPVHYNVYLDHVKKFNIGFAKVGEEECESCIEHEQHLKDVNNHGVYITRRSPLLAEQMIIWVSFGTVV